MPVAPEFPKLIMVGGNCSTAPGIACYLFGCTYFDSCSSCYSSPCSHSCQVWSYERCCCCYTQHPGHLSLQWTLYWWHFGGLRALLPCCGAAGFVITNWFSYLCSVSGNVLPSAPESTTKRGKGRRAKRYVMYHLIIYFC